MVFGTSLLTCVTVGILWKLSLVPPLDRRKVKFNVLYSHSQAGWAWPHLQVRGRARRSGASTKTWAGLSVGTEVGWSSSRVGWGLSPGAVGVPRGSCDWGGASRDSQSPHREAKVFWCVFQLCRGPSMWLPLCQPQPGSCGEQLKDQLTIWQLSQVVKMMPRTTYGKKMDIFISLPCWTRFALHINKIIKLLTSILIVGSQLQRRLNLLMACILEYASINLPVKQLDTQKLLMKWKGSILPVLAETVMPYTQSHKPGICMKTNYLIL